MAFVTLFGWGGRCSGPGVAPTRSLRGAAKDCLRAPENRSAAIGYYRANDASPAGDRIDGRYAAEQAALAKVGPQPILYLHGNLDGCISLDLVCHAKEHLPAGLQMTVIVGAGHFPHLEKPDVVNQHILAWIAP